MKAPRQGQTATKTKTRLPFTKMQGIGNDFVIVDLFKNPLDEPKFAPLAQAVCDRRFGIGADGLILVAPGKAHRFAMRMFNPDGSESEMCGNGVRCFAKFLTQEGHTADKEIPVETGAGLLNLQIQPDGQVKVDMGPAHLSRKEIGMTGDPESQFVDQPIPGTEFNGTAVSMGNPHLVIFTPNLAEIDLYDTARPLETHPLFPNRTNVHFVQVINPQKIQMKTWERGAGATLACGTGASACGVASVLNGHTDRNLTVTLPGGDLSIEYQTNGTVFMTGPAETAYQGVWDLEI